MPSHAMHPIQDLFLESFHIYYILISIFICTPICTKFYSYKKWVLHKISWNLSWVWFVLVGWFVEVGLIRLWVGHGVTP
jgi:hypothetical protein